MQGSTAMDMSLVSGCRLVVLHWLLLLGFLLFLIAHQFGGITVNATPVGALLMVSSLICAAAALLFGFKEHCGKCGSLLADQLPKQPVAGIEGLLLDQRSKAIIATAIKGRFRCGVCGNWC